MLIDKINSKISEIKNEKITFIFTIFKKLFFNLKEHIKFDFRSNIMVYNMET